MSTTSQQVEVIGVGIAGSAAARDLATKGYVSLVFEERNFTASKYLRNEART